MAGRTGKRIGVRSRVQTLLRIQLTEGRRTSIEELGTWKESRRLPGSAAGNADLGFDDQAEGDDQLDDESGSGEPGEVIVPDLDDADDEADDTRSLTLADLLGSRPPVVLFRVDAADERVTVRPTTLPVSRRVLQGLELLGRLVEVSFEEGRAKFKAEEWDQLLGRVHASPKRRLLLLLRLAIKPGDPIRFAEEQGGGYTPTDLTLERFANKFAALPDGTPFSLRLLLLDERGRKSGENDVEALFDVTDNAGTVSRTESYANTVLNALPDALKLLVLRRALALEEETGKADDDAEFCRYVQKAFKEVIGAKVKMPDQRQVQRLRSDWLKRNGLGHHFPNRRERQRKYDEKAAAAGPDKEEEVS
jgi:hypothetical protein